MCAYVCSVGGQWVSACVFVCVCVGSTWHECVCQHVEDGY